MAIPLRPRPVEEGGFERFTGKGTRHRGRLNGQASIGATGLCYLNLGVVEMLPAGDFPYIELYFNADANAIGFRPLSTLPANERHPKLCYVKGGGRSFSARSLLRQYGIPIRHGTFPVRFDQKLCLYVIDLNREIV